MSDLTYQQLLCAGLRSEGWRETDGSSKYRVFQKGTRNKMYVGSAGALRYGPTRSSTRSIGDPSNRTPTYNQILQAGEKVLKVDGSKIQARIDALKNAGQQMAGYEHAQNVLNEQTDPVIASFDEPSTSTERFDQVPCDGLLNDGMDMEANK